jgi:transcriptional regulator with XRE-family HTH domain
MNLKDLKKELLQDPGFCKEYYKKDLKLDIALMIEEARIVRGVTQKELAIKMGTKQTAISRAESGDYLPSLSFLQRMAKAFKTDLAVPKFAFLEGKQGISVDEIAKLDPATLEAAKLMKRNADSSISAPSSIFYRNEFTKIKS